MLIHDGKERSTAIDLRLAVTLATVAGGVNAAGFRAMGYFSANMTGNVSLLSEHLVLGEWRAVLLAAGLVAAFILGAFLSALLIERGLRRGLRGVYAYSIILEGGLIATLTLVDLAMADLQRSAVLLLGLSCAMGVQNAATTRISNAQVRTTHLSGVTTDLGIELAILCGGARQDATRGVILSRFRLHLATLLAFLAGGAAGAACYGLIGPGVYLLAAAILIGIAVPEARRVHRRA
ncbi:YoaK family protein [Pseudooceanicola nanhaiensis]|uniref:YoaK family protein n=1 Tax=Pseudooceanicola nanhaiensis TaxID=375761 RepID=UPI001CD68B01|nr:YoaK family protein [Pseudooceanicola nanhaiensis]MCA0921400.1 DUF1275 domain-containing protein [Pseudooceanicola nanhaiensis]